MNKKYLLNELDSLKRKEKESETYYMLPFNKGYTTEHEIKNALLMCYGICLNDNEEIPSLYLRQTHVCRDVSSTNLSAEHFLKYNQFTLAREFCRKEYDDPGRALELLDQIIKEK